MAPNKSLISTLTSVSVAALGISEDLWTSSDVTLSVVPSAAEEGVWLTLGDRGEVPLGMGEVEGVGAGEGRGERVPISTAMSSVQALPRLRRKSSVSLSTTSSLVRWGTSRMRFTTYRDEKWEQLVRFGACCSTLRWPAHIILSA